MARCDDVCVPVGLSVSNFGSFSLSGGTECGTQVSKPSTTHCRDVHFGSQCIRKVLKPQLSNYSFSFQLARWCNQEIALCSIYLSKTKTDISKTRLSFQFQFNLIVFLVSDSDGGVTRYGTYRSKCE